MSKSTNGLGQFRGKLGAVVYAVRNGQQIVRAYQPVVANPKSTAQSIQRAKGNLAGRISAITPWQILEGLGSNKYKRRSRFLRLLLTRITAGQAAGDPSRFNAKLANTDFVFSEGSVIPVYTLASALSATETTVVANLGVIPGYTQAMRESQGLLSVVVIKNPTLEFEQILYRFLSPDDLSEPTTQVTFIHRSEGAYYADFYVAPFSTADGTKLRTRTGVITSTATSLDALLEVGDGASPIVWGSSSLFGSASYTPA